jgi:hypothetical protein
MAPIKKASEPKIKVLTRPYLSDKNPVGSSKS